jgi:hypothetical protein
MGTLTKQERDALEDVFLAIHGNKLFGSGSSFLQNVTQKSVKKCLKMTNFNQMSSFFSKTKNFLRK